MNSANCMGSSLTSGVGIKTTNRGRVENALEELNDCISRLDKLTNESFDSVCMPRPCEPCDGVSCNSEPSLVQIIERLYNRVSSINERVIQTNNIIKEQLGSIRLD